MEEEGLNKSEVEESKKEAYRGRDSPLEWRRVRRSRKYRIRKWREDCWARIFALFRDTICSVGKACHEDTTKEKR